MKESSCNFPCNLLIVSFRVSFPEMNREHRMGRLPHGKAYPYPLKYDGILNCIGGHEKQECIADIGRTTALHHDRAISSPDRIIAKQTYVVEYAK